MDLGSYPLSAMRGAFGAEPTAVTSATPRLVPTGFDTRCDEAMVATYTFPNGGTGRVSCDLDARGGYWFPWLTSNWPNIIRDIPPWISIRLREEKHAPANGLESTSQRTIIFKNFMGPHAWHRIDVVTELIKRNSSGKVVEQKKRRSRRKYIHGPRRVVCRTREKNLGQLIAIS